MSHPGFTIINATFTTNSTTKYQFDNNICYHILLNDRFSVVKWYQYGEYHIFFSLASYSSDDMSSPKTQEEFLYGLDNLHTMYYFQTEHVYVSELLLTDKEGTIVCVGKNDEQEWKLSETDGCLGIYKLEGDILKHVHNDYPEAYINGLKKWESKALGILEKSYSEIS